MKLLQEILYKAGIEEMIGSTNVAIEQVHFDSRKVEKFTLFVAVRGTQTDGHEYIEKAIEQGALAVVCEELPLNIDDKVSYVRVANSAIALGQIAANYYGNPAEKLKLIGVTGTNGKTTTVSLLYKLFRGLGYKVGMLSTVSNKINNVEVEATHTTPDALQLNELLAKMVEKGCVYCFMEVSSHAVSQHRIAGVVFSGGVFTNITHDHLDYHGTFNEYIKAKKAFFDSLPETAFALTNKDDVHGEVMLQNCKASKHTLGLKSVADYKAKILENQFSGLQLTVDGNELWTKLIGGFNAYNVLTAYAVGVLLGEEKMDILTAISNLTPAEGRFQHIKTDSNITGIVDYAHTPDALKNVLTTIREIRTGNEKVISIVGCGGNRDKGKRPLMAKIACDYSDRVIITSDNPRGEDPEAIITEMNAGVDAAHTRKVISITNRKEAIKTACTMASNGDIILLAGKGHEKYQEINGERLPFDDMQILNDMLELIG